MVTTDWGGTGIHLEGGEDSRVEYLEPSYALESRRLITQSMDFGVKTRVEEFLVDFAVEAY